MNAFASIALAALTATALCPTTGGCQARPRVDTAATRPAGIVPIVIETERGVIDVALDSGRAPGTVTNFLRYIDGGFFANGRFHRTVTPDNQPRDSVRIEVIQGSARSIPRDSAFPPIELERTSVTGIKHTDGVISMARSGPNTATHSFFITIGAQPALDEGGKRNADGQGFAAFGRVTNGMNVVRDIQRSPHEAQNLTPPITIRNIRRAQPKRTADPLQRGIPLSAFPRLILLAPNVYGYEEIRQPGFTTVSLIVIGTSGVLIADGQGSTAATQTMLDRIKTITPLPIKWYVVGSDHGDHTAGNSVLPSGIEYIVHPTSLAQLKRDSAGAPATRRVIVPTTAMRGDEVTIDVGTMKVDVRFLGRAHTGGDLSVYLPSSRILFMSEAYLNRVFPAMRSAYPSEWVRTIDRALAMNVSRYVPGHGFIEDPATSREELVAFREALRAVIAEVTRLRALGLSTDDAVKQAQWGPYASWFLAEQQAPIAVRKVYEELAGTLK